MGASMALALRQNVSTVEIYGYDIPEVMTEARRRNIIDHQINQWPQDCRDADVIFLATPLRIIKKHLQELNDVVNRDCIVTDVGSTKQELKNFAEYINFAGVYVGGHPMTGAEKSGLNAANPLLYENAVYILTCVKEAEESLVKEKLYMLLSKIKARIMLLEADVHDRILAAISHLPQIIAIELVNLVGEKHSDQYPYFQLTAGGFRDLTRIASSPIEIWQDIIASNAQNIRDALQSMIGNLQKAMNNLNNLKSEFNLANQYRNQVPKSNKGFISQLTDVLVYVNDQMGVIAKISNALADQKIDIRDIELLKIREKEGGVFRLSFSTRKEADQAVNILNKIDYRAFIRE